jgi:hypothetical protein
MERLERNVRRELSRFDSLPSAELQRLVEVWPAAVGETIAANAWPARIAGDGTLHVATSSSTWAFELGQLASHVLERLAATAGGQAPKALRFAPGHLPEPAPPAAAEPVRDPPRPGPEEERAAAELVAGIDDDDLRAKVSKAAALGLARAASDRSF